MKYLIFLFFQGHPHHLTPRCLQIVPGHPFVPPTTIVPSAVQHKALQVGVQLFRPSHTGLWFKYCPLTFCFLPCSQKQWLQMVSWYSHQHLFGSWAVEGSSPFERHLCSVPPSTWPDWPETALILGQRFSETGRLGWLWIQIQLWLVTVIFPLTFTNSSNSICTVEFKELRETWNDRCSQVPAGVTAAQGELIGLFSKTSHLR